VQNNYHSNKIELSKKKENYNNSVEIGNDYENIHDQPKKKEKLEMNIKNIFL
jgi:isopenicillin N synthase-like dioxygenase